MNVELTWVDPDDLGRVEGGRPRRTPRRSTARRSATPAGNVLDIEAVAAIAHEHELPLIVDNTFATPYLCRPIEWGADIVIHSATKFIGGHGTSIGGVVVDSGSSTGRTAASRSIADPSPAYHGLQFHETFGTYGYLMKLRAETLRDLGAAMSPFNAFLFLQGLETLSLRMERHVENAAAVATLPRVARAGLERDLPRPADAAATGRSSTSTCRAAPARCSRSTAAAAATAGQDFIRGVTLWSHLANVGDSKSLIIHPASTTHRQLNDDELRAAGVGPGTIRLSVGTESVDDLIWDLEQGFARVGARRRARWRRDDPTFDLTPLPGSADDPARAPHREDDRDRRAVEERAARELLRRLLPQAPRLPRDSGEPARDGDPRREELPEPARRAGAGRHRQRLPRAGRAARDRRGGRGDRRRQPSGASSA